MRLSQPDVHQLDPHCRPTEINLQLTFPIKMERKLFKSPPIARLKSAPKKRTEKNIKVSSYTKESIKKYTRRLSIKEFFSPGKVRPAAPSTLLSPIPSTRSVKKPPTVPRVKSSRNTKSNKVCDCCDNSNIIPF